MEIEVCTKCGAIIEGDTCQDKDENIICEDCLIQLQAENMGLIKD